MFLDILQAFDRLIYKLKQFLPAPYYLTNKSSLENHTFVVRQLNLALSSYFCIQVGMPQGSDPLTYSTFTQPTCLMHQIQLWPHMPMILQFFPPVMTQYKSPKHY